ncbi:hypothetical protein P0W64_15065 [Tsukamurella sp. 8F]|uniref:hypothetical protein n=1 Tax=unclassified Tsukamurella TaxID=2633480 RepID=UPI0023BA1E33|nr:MULTISPECIES: hypothetical protein [unclassified Tsukamurella]MDF0532528.1 hypothetical protein [Tsukamurella sp. 8J]MDF0588098.1 hypothetical protein [Tsukamurella sp. 8F]
MSRPLTTDSDIVRTSYALLDEVDAGTTTAANLEAELAETMRAEFGIVGGGSDDPLWSLHLDVARQFIAAGGLTSAELREWLSVRLRAENGGARPENAAPDAPATDVATSTDGEPDDLDGLPASVLTEAEAAAEAVIERWRRTDTTDPMEEP